MLVLRCAIVALWATCSVNHTVCTHLKRPSDKCTSNEHPQYMSLAARKSVFIVFDQAKQKPALSVIRSKNDYLETWKLNGLSSVPHFYIVKLGFTEQTLVFLFLL